MADGRNRGENIRDGSDDDGRWLLLSRFQSVESLRTGTPGGRVLWPDGPVPLVAHQTMVLTVVVTCELVNNKIQKKNAVSCCSASLDSERFVNYPDLWIMLLIWALMISGPGWAMAERIRALFSDDCNSSSFWFRSLRSKTISSHGIS